MTVSNEVGTLYVVATPIGNLADISERARRILEQVDLIAAEDTRHSGRLLAALGIATPMLAMHEHNEIEILERLLQRLDGGQSIALISDAGTPLISDPGYPLIKTLRERGYRIVPVPGPNAAVTALSAAGIAPDRFLFLGFPPRASSARRRFFEELAGEKATLVFYESCHRLPDSVVDMMDAFGASRRAVLARELTKLHETFLDAPLAELADRIKEDENQQRGEMVVLVEGAPASQDQSGGDLDPDRLLRLLIAELPLKRAVAVTAELTGLRRNGLYQRGLELKGS